MGTIADELLHLYKKLHLMSCEKSGLGKQIARNRPRPLERVLYLLPGTDLQQKSPSLEKFTLDPHV